MLINSINVILSGLTSQQKIGWGLNGLVIGLGSVFTILVLLIAVINLLKISSADKKTSKPVKSVPAETVKAPEKSEKDENEIIAAIAAAINCMAQREGKRFAIKSYRRIGSRSKRSY